MTFLTALAAPVDEGIRRRLRPPCQALEPSFSSWLAPMKVVLEASLAGAEWATFLTPPSMMDWAVLGGKDAVD